MNDRFTRGAISKPLEEGQAGFAPVGVVSQSMVDTSQRLCQLISFMGEQTPTKKAKAKGAIGASIWVQLGDAPSPDASKLAFLGLRFISNCFVQYAGKQPSQKDD
jgi:hypothetical protein